MINTQDIRLCNTCLKPMSKGYYISNGIADAEHYCSDDCLHKHYTKGQYEEMARNKTDNWQEAYYSDWKDTKAYGSEN